MDLKLVKDLIEMVNKSSLASLEVEDKEIRVRLENQTGIVVKAAPIAQAVQAVEEVAEAPVEDTTNYKYIKSPIVGTFHTAEKVGKDAINAGDKITKGMVVCAVEAMKLMNTIESEFDGEFVELMAAEGDLVEYGQPLIKLK
jgi:acetyl-CoA carboxylase biotin carboxyl carrier protein